MAIRSAIGDGCGGDPQDHGHDLAMLGGIDKRAVAAGGDTMRRAVDRVMPVVEDGGYIPTLDHSAPPDITWQNSSLSRNI